MNRIDKLIIAARTAAQQSMELLPSFVTRNGHSWTAEVYLGDGVPGHTPTVKRDTFATLEAAVEHIRAMSQEYPNSRDVTVIIDDLG